VKEIVSWPANSTCTVLGPTFATASFTLTRGMSRALLRIEQRRHLKTV